MTSTAKCRRIRKIACLRVIDGIAWGSGDTSKEREKSERMNGGKENIHIVLYEPYGGEVAPAGRVMN